MIGAKLNIRPMSVAEINCLMVLAINDDCAYDIASYLSNDPRSSFSVTSNAVRKILKRLEALCYVRPREQVGYERISGNLYHLTEHGRKALARELEWWAGIVEEGRYRLELIEERSATRLKAVDDLHDLIAAQAARAGDGIPNAVIDPGGLVGAEQIDGQTFAG